MRVAQRDADDSAGVSRDAAVTVAPADADGARAAFEAASAALAKPVV